MSHRGKKKTQSMLDQLRKEAQVRQMEYDKLSTQEKLDRLPPAPAAERQRKRLIDELSRKCN